MTTFKFALFVISTLAKLVWSSDLPDLEILGIEPNAGPVYGETRVTVRIKNFDKNLIDTYDRPTCRFGSNRKIVNATYIACTPKPRAVGEPEPKKEARNETCIICEVSPPNEEDIVPFTVSLLGDFTDFKNSMPYRYYSEPVIDYIYPRYGPKDGGTFVEVFGRNFLNFDQNLRCAFGSREVKAFYVNNNYMICYSAKSDVVQKELPFSVSLNNQQNTKQNIDYVYYEFPQVFRLEPNKGPDTGGTVVHIRGQNFDPTIDLTLHNYNDTFCKFGNLSLTNAEVISSTEMKCTSPPSYEEREVPVEITLNNREWTQDEVLFYYYHPPFIYGINPKIGPVSGGTTVVITGSNFADTGFVMCRFGAIFVKGEYVSENELRCVAPPVENPGYVNLLVAIRPDEFSSGLNTKYLYYATPVIDNIRPYCGPEKGFTQITLIGENFADTGDEYVKCVFDGKIYMNATVYNDREIKCDSPSVLNYEGVNEKNITVYEIMITLNGKDLHGPPANFYYYKDTITTGVDPIYGPITGNTTVNITGANFDQVNACNTTVRFGTYHVKPSLVSDKWMIVTSPAANFTGAATIQVALNGRQFDKDIEVHERNKENSFYYYKDPYITDMTPKKGPTIGGTKVTIYGIGFNDVFYNVRNIKNRKIFYKFVDFYDREIQYGEIYNTTIQEEHFIEVSTPGVNRADIQALVYLSFNEENFEPSNEKLVFTYYTLPNITDINPKYGPLKEENQQVEVSLDNYFCVENCDNIYCSFSSNNNIFVMKGFYTRPNTVNCTAPNVNIPESYKVEISFNGDDYTNNGFNYTFYDPYVINVNPRMVTSKGGTKLDIYGFGFADSGENLKVQFGSSDDRLRCEGRSCIVHADYVNAKQIQAVTYALREVNEELSGENIGFRKFAVEASVYNNDFTVNNVTIFYYDEPEVIDDILAYDIPMNSTDKETIANALLRNIPANLDTIILVPIDSRKINKYYSQFNEYANYTCKFTMVDNPEVFKVTKGLVTSYPEGSDLNNLYLCQSPIWEEVGRSNITISLNGYDYSEKSFSLVFTDPIKIFSIKPPCGPRHGNTKLTILGTGFIKSADYFFKMGVENIVRMNETSIINTYNSNTNTDANSNKIDISTILPAGVETKFEVQEIEAFSPVVPDRDFTLGGPNYVSYSKASYYPISFLARFYTNNFIHTNLEFFYYHQPWIHRISPHGSIVTGGTKVMVTGAWFDYQPEYEVKPYCRFGNKIVEAEFLSTVRITCMSPPYDTANVRVPFEVSLNGIDFTNSGTLFTYYNDYTKAKFYNIEPTSGPETGGTAIKVYGESLTSLLNPEEFLCQFVPNDANMEPKRVPAGFKDFGNNKTAIICNTPGGWTSGTVADIKITFDGQNYIDTGFDFYFYKITHLEPAAGPTAGNGPIQVMGSGFQNSTKVKCMLNQIEMKPIDVLPDRILCPMTKSSYGLNFTGAVDFGVTLNGIDWKLFPNGFYYYVQPLVNDIFPQYGPSKGHAIVKVYGAGFRSDFPGSRTGCRVGRNFGAGVVKSTNEIECTLNSMPILEFNKTLNFTVALNNYSFTEERVNLNFTPYGVALISPSSGPIQGGTRIQVKGAGFFDSKNIRCRFGVPGWYGYTEGQFIDYNKVVCTSPLEFKLPEGGKLPFSVPFSIAFNEDDFNPWTETTHFFTLYENPKILMIDPKEGKTKDTQMVSVYADIQTPFSLPSASIEEIEYIDYSKSLIGETKEKKAISYQPISCKFGRFGVTEGTYFNRTLIKCLTPTIQDDSDIGYEEVPLEIALNGVDYVTNEEVPYTFIGPNAGRMLWVYILITIFTALLLILLAALVSSYWNKLQLSDRNVYAGQEPHVLNKKPKYFNDVRDLNN